MKIELNQSINYALFAAQQLNLKQTELNLPHHICVGVFFQLMKVISDYFPECNIENILQAMEWLI